MGRAIYAIPGVLALIGIVLVIVGIVSVAGEHSGFRLKPFTNGSTLNADSDGFGVYSGSTLALSSRCTASGGGRTITLERPFASETITLNGQSYQLIARTPESIPAGTYRVSCTGGAALATGARGIGSAIAGIFEIIGGILLFIVALVVLLIVFLVRRSRRQKPPAGVGGGQPQYGQPQYGQPGTGQPVYGQPPYGLQQPPGYSPPQSG